MVYKRYEIMNELSLNGIIIMKYLAVLSIFVVSVLCEDTPPYVPVKPCTDEGDWPIPLGFQSLGCEKTPCPLYQNTTSQANITFLIPEDTNGVTIDVKAKVLGTSFWVPYLLPDKNVCHGLVNSYCPLDKNEVVIYHLAIPVLPLYPRVSLTLKVKLLDEYKNIISCMKVDCKVMKNPSRNLRIN